MELYINFKFLDVYYVFYNIIEKPSHSCFNRLLLLCCHIHIYLYCTDRKEK